MAGLMHIAPPGGSPAAPTFDAPLDIIEACHERVQAQCETLRRLAEHLQARPAACPPDAAATEAAAAVLRYFDLAAPHHHADEEEQLFPALLQACSPAALPPVQDLVHQLLADHRRLDQQWQALRPTLAALATGHQARLTAAQAQAFADAYLQHLHNEEAALLPAARRWLPPDQLQPLGAAMRRRRGDTA